MATDKKRRIPSSVLWGGLGVVILLLGAGSAVFYFSRSQEDSEGPLGFIQNLLGRFTGPAVEEGDRPPGEAPPRETRTYTVRDGDNLWAIARKGELVDNPWEWRSIVVQNRDKIDYTFVSEETGEWKVMLEKGQTLEVTPPPPPDPTVPVKKKYALQLMSAPESNLNGALKIVKMLLADKYYAYLYRIEIDGTQYYRIRVGFFETKFEAEQAGEKIHERYGERNIFPDRFMVFLPSFREMRGERLDFGVQKNKPWVIEFPQRATHEKALEDLKKISSGTDFAYIAQKKDKITGLFLYRTRVGFFPTADEAKAVIQGRRQGKNGLWSKARVIGLHRFQEALPGQQVKFGGPDGSR